MCTPRTRSPTWTRSPPAGSTCASNGYRHAWGIGRHIQGSQIFDYWRDPDRLMFEHYADGDVFDASVEPGWLPMSASGLAQWGPKATRDFLGTGNPATVVAAIKALREGGNDIDLATLRGLLKAMAHERQRGPHRGRMVGRDTGRARPPWRFGRITTGELLSDRQALHAAIVGRAATPPRQISRRAVPSGVVEPARPVTSPARVVAQMVNYRSHAPDSGPGPGPRPARPSSARPRTRSPARPATIVRPAASSSLTTRSSSASSSGADLPVGTTVTDGDLAATSARWSSRTTSAPARSS